MNTASESALRSLDPASGALDQGQRQRADLLLERIVSTPAEAPAGPGRRRTARKLVWVAAVAAAITIGSIVVPGTRGTGAAYASWSATPSPVAAHDLETVARACRHQLSDNTIPVALAERRGEFVAVLFHRNNPDTSSTCMARNRPGSTTVKDIQSGTYGSSSPAWTPPAGRITRGAIAQYGDQPASFTDGAVGAGVIGVTIHAGTRTVTTTVTNGRYAAWWPGKARADDPREPSGPSGKLLLTYDVHLASGRTRINVSPAHPR